MKFTKEKTNIAKGVAICLMFVNHLYSFPDRLLNENYYIPLIPFFNLEHYVGDFGSICVSMFIFLSGYGMYLGHSRSQQSPLRYSLEKLKDFYLTYWTYFLIFVPIGLMFFKEETLWNSAEIRYSAELNIFLEGFFGWSARYNGEWWFVRMFVSLLLFLCPFYLSLKKRNPILLCLISISLFLLSWILKIDYNGVYSFFFWQISFAIGLLCANFDFFSLHLIKKIDKFKAAWFLLGIIFCFFVRFRFGAKADFLFIPIFIYFVIRIVERLRLSKLFVYIGKFSFPMWLVHSFFCYYYFQNFIYFPRWSPIIFIFLTSTSFISVVVIENFRFYLQKKLRFYAGY